MDYSALNHSGRKAAERAYTSKRSRVLTAVGASLLIGCGLVGGCDEPSSPRGAVQRAALALLSDNHAALRASLDGGALARYGDRDGAQQLAQVVKGRELVLAEATLRYRDQPVEGFDRLRIYSVPVLDKASGSLALEATVTCAVHWVSQDGYAYRQPVPVRGTQRLTEGYTPVESCRVSAVSFPGAGGTAPDAALCASEAKADAAPRG
ncbi:MAG: hypothetical protein U1A78_29420 [Polyangia bacterium]